MYDAFARVFPEVPNEVQAEREQRMKDRLATRRLRELEERLRTLVSKLGRRYADATLGGFQVDHDAQRRTLDRVRGYAEAITSHVSEGHGLVLFGPPGTGKDHLAVGVLRRAIGAGFTCEAIDGQGLFQQSRDAIGSERLESEWLKPYLAADVLLISDPLPPLGSTTGHQLSVLWRIIDGRYRDRRPTIVTANVATRTELESRLAPNIVDRLIDGALVLPCYWPTYRRAMAAP